MNRAVSSRRRNPVLAALAVFALSCSAVTLPAAAEENDAVRFMEQFTGEWRGTGRLLVGPETGLRFHCALDGNPSRTELTFNMNGKCWAGKLWGLVHARLHFNAETNRFYGDFLGGAINGCLVLGEK